MVTHVKAYRAVLLVVVLLVSVCGFSWSAYIEGQEEPTRPGPPPPPPPVEVVAPRTHHVAELGDYLNRLKLHNPLSYNEFAIYPLTLSGEPELTGRWLSAERALTKGLLRVSEKPGGGSVPHVVVSNRSRRSTIFIMAGQVLSGGKQTRTVRQDVVLAPRQTVDIGVFCVERGRWSGDVAFKSSGHLVPQSIQKELRKGTDQTAVWAEVTRTNGALGTKSRTDNLEAGMTSKRVRENLEAVRKALVPEVPSESVGFIFVHRGRLVGAEFFGSPYLAGEYLPKLIDAYAVDLVLQRVGTDRTIERRRVNIARLYLEQIRRAGSVYGPTPGSGAGIQTRSDGLVGNGVSLTEEVVHYGVQPVVRIMPVVTRTGPTRRNNEPENNLQGR